ncbi:hypothetical protein SAMN05216344_10158 [Polaromonas sp. OV174]|nr:hypothetical protein SAMN05216344_10158 [Polaromonas sp. OV174]
MSVSIFQRFMFGAAACGYEPIQSRADQNTRNVESGSQSEKNPDEYGLQTVLRRFQWLDRRQTHQKNWHQLGPDCSRAVGPNSRSSGLRVIHKPLPRGETS